MIELDPDTRRPPGYWTRERCIAAARAWAALYGDPPSLREWNQAQARAGAERMRRRWLDAQERAERWAPHVYPTAWTVRRVFGTWRAFQQACGHPVRAQGRQRRRLSLMTVDAQREALSESVRLVAIAQREGNDVLLAEALDRVSLAAARWRDLVRSRSAS